MTAIYQGTHYMVRGRHVSFSLRFVENMRRIAERATTCRAGHPRNEANAYPRPDRPGQFMCRVCKRDRDRERRRG